MRRLAAITLLCIFSLVGSAAVAEDAWVVQSKAATELGGGVLVNSGDGWRRVPTDQGVGVGYQVMAQGGAEGWLLYCGCDVPLKPGRIYNVEARDCPVYGVRYDEGLPHTTMTKPLEEEAITRCRAPVAWWLLSGAVVGVGVCATAGCFDDDDDRRRPASP